MGHALLIHPAPAGLVAALMRIHSQEQERQCSVVPPFEVIQEMLVGQRCGEPLALRLPRPRGTER